MIKKIIAVAGCFLVGNALLAQTLPQITEPSFKKDTFNILRYGAKPDGNTLNTEAINNAVADSHKNGGGVVLVPNGFWITGPVVLLSNVNLCVDKDALLQFTDDKTQYKLVEGNYEGLPAYRNQSPISASNAENIAVTGQGIIDANGGVWRAVNRNKVSDIEWNRFVKSGGIVDAGEKHWYPSESYVRGTKVQKPGVILPGKTIADYADIKDFLRPNLLVFTRCKKILLEGVTFQNSPAWCLHPLMCENLTVRNVYVKNPWFAQNGDGIDVESCSNVLIEGSTFDVGDDGICIKSGRDAEGRKRGMPTQNVIVRNCVVYHAHGGFVIGSEMSGGAKNIFVNNCTFIGSDIGLRFKTTRGRGGIVENIFVKDIYMKDIPGDAILFDMYYAAKDPVPAPGEKDALPAVELKPVDETTPVFRNFTISNIYCNNAEKAVFIRGLPEMHIQNITLENMVLNTKKGLDIQEATNISFKNVNLITAETDPVVHIINSNDIVLDSIGYNKNAATLLKLSGDRTKNIKLVNTNTTDSKEAVVFSAGADKAALVKE